MHTVAGCDGNGFELWRALFRDYEGGNAITQSNEINTLVTFPACHERNRLQNVVNDWLDLVRRVGSGFSDETLRVMLINILPADLKSDVLKTTSLDTADKILEWLESQLTYLRSEQISSASSKLQLHHLGVEQVAVKMAEAGLDKDLIKSYLAAVAQRPPKGGGRGRGTDTRGSKGNGQGAGTRSPSAGSSTARSPGFRDARFVGCWHCVVEGHSRSQCGAFIALRAQSGG